MTNLLERATRPDLHRGLEDVVVDESELSVIDGDAGELRYHGYPIESLASDAAFEEVLHLLWQGALPDEGGYEKFREALAEARPVEDAVLATVRTLAERDAEPTAALRTGTSMLSVAEPEPEADPADLDATRRVGRRIAAKMPTLLAAFDRFRRGKEPVAPDPDLGHAANFLYMLTGEEPEELHAETFDVALTLHADHGLNASTFTAMVVASTYADIYNAVTAGIAALSGPWHGGANQEVMETLLELDDSGEDPVAWTEGVLEEGGRVPGFGHRVYDVMDPRAVILKEFSQRLGERTGEARWYEYTTAIEDYLMTERELGEKGLAPNVDFYSGSVYYQLGIPIDLYTPIFAVSRVGGWIGHVLEYQAENRLIRPRARYVGPEDQTLVPRGER